MYSCHVKSALHDPTSSDPYHHHHSDICASNSDQQIQLSSLTALHNNNKCSIRRPPDFASNLSSYNSNCDNLFNSDFSRLQQQNKFSDNNFIHRERPDHHINGSTSSSSHHHIFDSSHSLFNNKYSSPLISRGDKHSRDFCNNNDYLYGHEDKYSGIENDLATEEMQNSNNNTRHQHSAYHCGDEQLALNAKQNSMNGNAAAAKHPLEYTWCLFMLQDAERRTQKSWNEIQVEVHEFSTVEDFWCMVNHIHPPSTIGVSDYSLFKKGIKPAWEDAAVVEGGRWVAKLPIKMRLVDEIWIHVIMAMIGESLFADYSNHVCGAVVSLRPRSLKMSLWINSRDPQSAAAIGTQFQLVLQSHVEPKDHKFLELTFQSFKESIEYRLTASGQFLNRAAEQPSSALSLHTQQSNGSSVGFGSVSTLPHNAWDLPSRQNTISSQLQSSIWPDLNSDLKTGESLRMMNETTISDYYNLSTATSASNFNDVYMEDEEGIQL